MIELIGTLTITSGSNITSGHLSQSVYSKFDAIGIFPSGNLTGTATLQATPFTDTTAFRSAQNPPGTAITVTGQAAIYIESFPYEAIQMSASVAQPAATSFTFIGQRMAAVGGTAAL